MEITEPSQRELDNEPPEISWGELNAMEAELEALRAQVEAVKNRVATCLEPAKWKIALAWRKAFLRSGNDVSPLDPETVHYLMADAMMLREVGELLEPAKDGTT